MSSAIYVRVWTQRQAQTQTIEQQIERLRAHARGRGEPLAHDDIFRDDGYSGASRVSVRRIALLTAVV
jgi:DNA invertase Pin-like site-specific DNA recombinase